MVNHGRDCLNLLLDYVKGVIRQAYDKVNGKIVTNNYILKNGDIVEILTSKTPAPRLDWLTFVATKQASQKIKQWFKKNNREEHVKIGKTNLEHELTKAIFDEYFDCVFVN